MMRGGEGREGDWECSGCANRNYAFRSFCNRCKQPRVLVDHKTPADSKWLPRIGDWICSGCTNNNYASREKCKKCGQPKEVAAMPAVAMSGASLPTHPQYFASIPGVHEQKMNMGFYANGAPQPSLPLTSGWPLGGVDNYGIQTADKFGVQPLPAWPLGGIHNNGIAYTNQANQVMVQKGWRNGDWICKCGFHNYSSRLQCKKCDAPMPPALGTKRLASEDVVQEWDNKRLNAGHTFGLPQAYPSFEQNASTGINQTGIYPNYPGGSSSITPNLQVNVQVPQLVTPSALYGKGARQWRGGDWMCTNCSNHNYASRAECNRCKTQREGPLQPIGADIGASIVGADAGASADATTVPGVGISAGYGVT